MRYMNDGTIAVNAPKCFGEAFSPEPNISQLLGNSRCIEGYLDSSGIEHIHLSKAHIGTDHEFWDVFEFQDEAAQQK